MISTTGKLKDKDEMIASLWKWLPWLSFFLVTLPAPIAFFLFFLTAGAADSAAFFLFLVLLSFGLGALAGLSVLVLLLLYRRRWFRRLRDRLAEDGITAAEVTWFTPELTSAERQTLREIQQQNPLLADAYCETLASRLTATRIITRVREERLKVERRLNRARALVGADTASLLTDLQSDHQQLEHLRNEATGRLAEARARLQMIEAAASRTLNQTETNSMLRRLTESQNHLPLAIEMAKLEQQILREAEVEVGSTRPDTHP
ncbi:MAG: hypothetical protein ACRD6N_17380 [Pyrinomonadaceae bacterium]